MVRLKSSLLGGVQRAAALIALLVVMAPDFFRKATAHSADWGSSLSAMLVVVYKRLRHNLGLTISAVLGIVAVMGMVVSVPIFSHAVSSQVLSEQLTKKAVTTRRGLFSLHMYYLDQRSLSPITVEKAEQISNYIRDTLQDRLGLHVSRIVMETQTGSVGWRPVQTQASSLDPESAWLNMGLAAVDLVPEHGELVEGTWPVYTDSGPVQVAVLEYAADEYFINVGDHYKFGNFEIEVTAIWRPINSNDTIWFETPRTAYQAKFWVPMEIFRTRVREMLERPIFYVSWYTIVDETRLRYDNAPQYARGLVQLGTDLSRMLPTIATDYSPLEALNTYRNRAQTLTNLFYAVGGPMIVLALLFISLTANIAMQQYEQETATMRGRGTSWAQVAALNVIESAALLVAALPLALLVGYLAALLMSKTLSFLQFTNREGMNLSLEGVNLLWMGLAALLILVARFLPMMNISRTSIVRVKQETSRSTRKPLWERFYLDFILLIPGIYSYVTLSGVAKPVEFLSALQPTEGETYRDPLLFVAPSLFAMALCMIVLRLLPLLLKGLAKVVDNLPHVWAYLSLQQVARRPQDHSSALLLIMISLSLAIYSASTAKTLDKWLHDSAYYNSGADLVLKESLLDPAQIPGVPGTPPPSSRADFSLEGLTIEDHLKLDAVENATRVGKYEGLFSYGMGEHPATFMGIDRLEFPKVAFWRDDFANQSLGGLMNALAMDSTGVLLPSELLEDIGLRVGDTIDVSVNVASANTDLQMTIVGTYDYFPTIFPSDKKPTLIVNLTSLFDHPDAVVDYDFWLDLKEDADIPLVLFQIRQMLGFDLALVEVQGNALEEVRLMMDQPERVGLFGVLNVGFIATGLMPGIGFLLYSYASLRRRFIQLGILQAIGLSVKQLIGYLALEQCLLMGVAISLGAVIGLISSHMFVPFLQIGATRGAPVPPFEVLIGWSESGWLSFGFALVLFLTMLGTIWYLVQMKVFQAVKMGEAM